MSTTLMVPGNAMNTVPTVQEYPKFLKTPLGQMNNYITGRQVASCPTGDSAGGNGRFTF